MGTLQTKPKSLGGINLYTKTLGINLKMLELGLTLTDGFIPVEDNLYVWRFGDSTFMTYGDGTYIEWG